MSDPLHSTTEWSRSQFDAAGDRMFRLGILISTWLVVGNAAALVLSFNAMTSGRLCDFEKFAPVIYAFVWGLGNAFIGVSVNYFGGMLGLKTLGTVATAVGTLSTNQYFIEKLQADGIEVDDEAPLSKGIQAAGAAIQGEQKRMWRLWATFALSIAFYAASAISFASGVLLPLSEPVSSAICPASEL